jgi:prepilin-type processing-associated H-X9-DG protein
MNNGLSSQDNRVLYFEEYFNGVRSDAPIAFKQSSNFDYAGSGNFGNAELRYREARNQGINVVFADGHAELRKISFTGSTNGTSTLVQSNMRPRTFDTRRTYKPTAAQW